MNILQQTVKPGFFFGVYKKLKAKKTQTQGFFP